MAIGKRISLEEAQKRDQLDRFIEEHPSSGDRAAFEALLDAMSKGGAIERPDDDQSRQPRKPRRGRG